MEKRYLKEFVTFAPGVNPTRLQKQPGSQEIVYYDQLSFEADFNHGDVDVDNKATTFLKNDQSLKAGEVVMSNSLRLATIVGQMNVGKVLSLNFTKIEFVSEQLDKIYFLFLFNAYQDVRRQKERELQGTGPVLRIPIHAIGEMMIPVIPLDEQKKIGAIYTETLKLQSKLKQYTNLIEQFTSTILEESLKGD